MTHVFPPNPSLQRTSTSVASLPPLLAAEDMSLDGPHAPDIAAVSNGPHPKSPLPLPLALEGKVLQIFVFSAITARAEFHGSAKG
jgi:hypothetical protein